MEEIGSSRRKYLSTVWGDRGAYVQTRTNAKWTCRSKNTWMRPRGPTTVVSEKDQCSLPFC